MTATERWRRIEEICQSALDLPDADRAGFLAAACGSDERLRHDLEKLLSKAQDAEAFLTQPLAAIAAHVLPPVGEELSGGRLGVLEIGAPLGRGGMGEVYRARDTRLGRDVALKVLPDAFARDPERLARFQREAKVLASLNHPNIAAIYGVEESGKIHGLVLELVEGPTLADRLARGAMPLAEALAIARQLAEGIEAAHERGVVHRDLKPANIKLRPDGVVKVLDFGLARALDESLVDAGSEQSSTSGDLSGNTSVGALVGTPEYMSPEQRKGLRADKRSDIWAFGAMVYEMLTGRRIATTTAATTASRGFAFADDIDWTGLPSATPAFVKWLIGRCLAGDARHRLRDIGEARILLETPGLLPVSDPSKAPAARGPQAWLAAVAAGTAVAIAASAWAWYSTRPAPPGVTRFSVPVPQLEASLGGGPRIAIALSPDGSQLVFAAQNRLYLRALSDAEVRPIRGSESHQLATAPVFSPDGRFVVFWALSDHTLKRLPVTGGSAEAICAAENPFGIDWTAEHILFGQDGKGILRVAPGGGEPTPIVTVGDGEQADSPQLLPGGTHVMFTLATGTARDRWDQARVVAQSLASGQRKILLTGGSHARYVATGHLVYAVSGTLFARPFDLRRLEVTGDALPVIVGIGRSVGGTTGVAQFAVSNSGSLAYVAGPLSVLDGAASHLALIDRRGLVEPLKVPAGVYVSPRVSPDGSRIAFGTDNGKEAIVWTYELSGSRAMQQLTTVANDRFPIWTSDSKRIVFQSDREGDRGLFWQPADGTGIAERLTRAAPGEAHIPDSWSPVSNTLMFSVATGSVATSRRYSLATLSLPDRTTATYGGVQSADPPGAMFSPNGRWVAYSMTQDSRTTVYVQPFPATGPPFPLPARGFDTPHAAIWSPNGKELFYTARPSDFEAVSVTTQPSFKFGVPAAVPSPFRLIPPYRHRSYDITPDGRFLGSVAAPSEGSDTGPASEVQVVLNWFRELRERVPPGR